MNKSFIDYLDIKSKPNCTSCLPGQKCSLLTQDDIHYILTSCDSKCKPSDTCDRCRGCCSSCHLPLSIFDEEAREQKLSCFGFIYDKMSNCRSRGNVKVAVCRACLLMYEICYYDFVIFNNYRYIMFENVDHSPTYYFPKLENIDEKERTIDVSIIKKIGSRPKMERQWLLQEGFVVFPITGTSIEDKFIEDRRRRDDNENRCKKRNPIYSSDFYPRNDPDIQMPTKSVQMSSDGKDFKEVKDKSRKRKTIDLREYELCKNQKDIVVFKIPIDPRKNMQKKSLSSIALIKRDRRKPKLDDNYLFTTQLLSTLSTRFDYDELIRWS